MTNLTSRCPVAGLVGLLNVTWARTMLICALSGSKHVHAHYYLATCAESRIECSHAYRSMYTHFGADADCIGRCARYKVI